MFMPMNSKKNWANRGATKQTRQANERTSGTTSKRTNRVRKRIHVGERPSNRRKV